MSSKPDKRAKAGKNAKKNPKSKGSGKPRARSKPNPPAPPKQRFAVKPARVVVKKPPIDTYLEFPSQNLGGFIRTKRYNELRAGISDRKVLQEALVGWLHDSWRLDNPPARSPKAKKQ